MAEDTEGKKKNRIPIFERLNQKYGKEEVNKRIGESADVPSGDFYRFDKNEEILIKQHPEAVYSPNKFKYSDDGWGYVGNLQRCEEIKVSKETGEAALIYPFGLSENQLWELLGKVKGIFPQWSSEIDDKLEVLDGLLIDINVSTFEYEKPNGEIEERKKVRFTIVKSGNGYKGYKNRLIWLKNKVAEITGQPQIDPDNLDERVSSPLEEEKVEQQVQPPLKF